MRSRPVPSAAGVNCGPFIRTGFEKDSVADVSTIMRAAESERAHTNAPSARGSPLATPWVRRGRWAIRPGLVGGPLLPGAPQACKAAVAGTSKAPASDARRRVRRGTIGPGAAVGDIRSSIQCLGYAMTNAAGVKGHRLVAR